MPRGSLNTSILLSLALAAGTAAAMEVRVMDKQIIMSGVIDGGELAKLRDVLADPAARGVDTVVLRDSPGGDYWTAQRVAELIRQRGWRTAVSGYCFSGCALMFLGGLERHFTDDKPVTHTQLAFHGTYYASEAVAAVRGELNRTTTWAARQWIKQYTGGKVSEAMLDRFEQLPRSDFIHFVDSARLPRKDVPSIFVCPRDKDSGTYRCKPIGGTDVYREGIVTTQELIRSADRRGQ